MNIPEEIRKLKELHDDGVLTDEEFAQAKAKLLRNENSTDHISEETVPKHRITPHLEEGEGHSSVKQNPGGGLAWMVPVAIVLGVFVLYAIFSGSLKETGDESDGDNSPIKEKESHQVKLHGTYYVFVSMVELNEKDSNGDDWDDPVVGSKSSPDIYYQIFRGEEVVLDGYPYCGENNFVNEWDGYDVNMVDAAWNGVWKGKGISFRDFIRGRTYLVSIEKGKTLTVKVYDYDGTVIGDGDPAGEVPLDLWNFNVGETELWQTSDGQWLKSRPASDLMTGHGIKRIKIRIFDSSKAPEFIAEQMGVPLGELKSKLGL